MKTNKRGVSLIVLVITIIIMIIIAGAIILALNGSGIVGKAKEAKIKTNQAVIKEKIYTALQSMMLDDNFEQTKNGIRIIENRGKNVKIVEDVETGIKYRVDLRDNTIEENYVANDLKNWALNVFSDYRDSIKTVSFVKYINVPEGAINYDLSQKQDKSIIGWLETNQEDDEMYDLYVGSNGTIVAKNINDSFSNWSNVEKISFNNFDTYDVRNFRFLFLGCSSLTDVNLEYLETSNVTNMNGTFNSCKALTGTIDLSNWNIENVQNFAGMFSGVRAKEIIMPGKNSKATTMEQAFRSSETEKIVLSGLTGADLTALHLTFYLCSNLKYLDLSSFNFDNITDWFIWLSTNDTEIKVYVKDQEAKNYLIDHKPNALKAENIIIK